MNAIMPISVPEPVPSEGARLLLAANDEVLVGVGRRYAPEPLMVVQFIGLNATEQARALASFPGAGRCRLVQS